MLGDWRVIADFPALLITFAITVLVYIGIRESKIVGNAMTILKIAVVLLVIVLGAFYVTPDNWTPFAPNGFSGVMAGVAAVFFAYIGFDALSTTAEECENPRRDLPRAMIYSLVICTVLYIALALVLTGMESYTNLNVGDPLAFVFRDKLPWVSGVDDWQRILQRRSRRDFSVCFYGDCLRIFRALLRGFCVADSDCGFGLYLRLRFVRRTRRLDYRLGFDCRILHRQHRRRYFLERLFYALADRLRVKNSGVYDDGLFERVARICRQ
jgi:hypothetical protein